MTTKPKASPAEKPWELLKDVSEEFGYSPRTAENLARDERFPCPTYKLAGKWVVDKEVKAAFFAARRAQGLAQLRNSTKG